VDDARVISVSVSAGHTMSKNPVHSVELLAGLGVVGDAHRGVTVQHLSRVARDPSAANLRQVHLLHAEVLEELAGTGFAIAPGRIGENITTIGIDLLALPSRTQLEIGATAVVEVTGLRNPCRQLDGIEPGLMAALRGRDANGQLVRKAGVMAVVVTSGAVTVGDRIGVRVPAEPHAPLGPV
jgi:MOSC domain-containing protein YiiM